jgi:hypothetical protein
MRWAAMLGRGPVGRLSTTTQLVELLLVADNRSRLTRPGPAGLLQAARTGAAVAVLRIGSSLSCFSPPPLLGRGPGRRLGATNQLVGLLLVVDNATSLRCSWPRGWAWQRVSPAAVMGRGGVLPAMLQCLMFAPCVDRYLGRLSVLPSGSESPGPRRPFAESG